MLPASAFADPILSQLDAVPGVVGTLLSDGHGRLLAHRFPPAFDLARVRQLAALAARASRLAPSVGQVGTVDLRFAEAHVVIRPVGHGRLLFLCTPAVSLQALLPATATVVRSLEAVLGQRG